eukprot:403377152
MSNFYNPPPQDPNKPKKSSVDDFLNNKNEKDLESLKRKYFDSSNYQSNINSSIKPPAQNFSEQTELEEYLRKQKIKSQRRPIKEWFRQKLMVEVGRKKVYFWKARQFEEVMYLHLPRFLFLSASCYIIYQINLRQRMNQRWRSGVQSQRQQDIQSQIDQISTVIGANQPNQFEALKSVEFDKSYSGDQFSYQYQLEEKQLQEKLFQLYDELEEEVNPNDED